MIAQGVFDQGFSACFIQQSSENQMAFSTFGRLLTRWFLWTSKSNDAGSEVFSPGFRILQYGSWLATDFLQHTLSRRSALRMALSWGHTFNRVGDQRVRRSPFIQNDV